MTRPICEKHWNYKEGDQRQRISLKNQFLKEEKKNRLSKFKDLCSETSISRQKQKRKRKGEVGKDRGSDSKAI